MKNPSRIPPVRVAIFVIVLSLAWGARSFAVTSADLTKAAWKAYNASDYKEAITNASKCIEMFKEKALEQQREKSSPHPSEQYPWALNDVAACFYIQGMSEEKLGKTDEAMKDYKFLVDKLNLAVCKGDKGDWYPFKPAQDHLAKLQGGGAPGAKVPDTIVHADMNSITVKTASGGDTYKIGMSTKITVKGAAGSSSDLKTGMTVVVTTSAADAHTADTITAN